MAVNRHNNPASYPILWNNKWRRKDWNLAQFRQTIDKVDHTAGKYGWNAFFLDNHNYPRALSHFGDDRPQWRAASAKALATLILTQRATPFIYQGSELGMTNYPFKKWMILRILK